MTKKNKRWKHVPRRCKKCLKWFGTDRGMRDHLRLKHGIEAKR